MPVVALPDGRRVRFPDGMDTSAMQSEIEKSFPEFSAKQDLTGFLNAPPATPTETSPVTGQLPPTLRPTTTISPVPQTERAAIEAQQPVGSEIPVEIGAQPATFPRFGASGTLTRGVSDVIGGLAEWAMNQPEEALATLTPLAPAIAMRYGPGVARQFAEDVVAGARGDRQALGRALTMGALVAAPALAKRAGERALVEGEPAKPLETPDAVARAGMEPGTVPSTEAVPVPVPTVPIPETRPVEAAPATAAALRETERALPAETAAVEPAKVAEPAPAVPPEPTELPTESAGPMPRTRANGTNFSDGST